MINYYLSSVMDSSWLPVSGWLAVCELSVCGGVRAGGVLWVCVSPTLLAIIICPE
jgi:hypothetical protein